MQQISLDEWIESNARRGPSKEKRKRALKGMLSKNLPKQTTPFVVYGIRCPVTNVIVYIGATHDLLKRAQTHFSRTTGKLVVSAWMRDIRRSNLAPTFEILGGYKSEVAAGLAEIAWIESMRPRLNSSGAKLYIGPGWRRKEPVVFPNGLEVDQCTDSVHSKSCDLMPCDSLAVRKIKLAIKRGGIRITTIAHVAGTTCQGIGFTLSGKTRPRLSLALRLSELFCFPIEDWTTHHSVASQEVAA